ncbi:ABC transporter ATP-binding protein [Coxiella burnetii]|uniref:ABC transporter ATP-binding protein n=1 Tax=Coxiella burnetii TaxID=777 RepID=UPI0009B5AA9B|nr:ATP-binding cassette domain-containing protein [Coxiella burnetii]AZV75982.1 ATP-binding cassette domain-containing protein [Coxiella burnetii]MDE3401624.1 ATP-binding cassette domain-containing protein [Coxiella burnetii]OYK91086.1 ABC transporter ATP-binding protein [Coxiella burnetii]PNT81119.1 ABC transporter ATP-binding protein [Coxiella burnetii]PNT82089.1 ABC transporter ATP-binding protein [Coxiella burnetii]
MMTAIEPSEPLIEIHGLCNEFGEQRVHDDLNLTIHRGEIVAIIGPSGCGKTTLLRSILMLRKPTAGTINVFGINILECSRAEALSVQRRWGVMFQSSALFSSLRVLENVLFPLHEYSHLHSEAQTKLALLKIALVGLDREAVPKYPAELSGGMKKRAALARAMALDPELLFLDEPTTGLDAKSARELNELILHLRKTLELTFVMVTHDLDTLWQVPDRVFFLGEGKVLAALPMDGLVHHKHPLIQDYFGSGKRTFRDKLERGAKDGYKS